MAHEATLTLENCTSAFDVWSYSMIFISLILNKTPKRWLKDDGYKELNYHRNVEKNWVLPTLLPNVS